MINEESQTTCRVYDDIVSIEARVRASGTQPENQIEIRRH